MMVKKHSLWLLLVCACFCTMGVVADGNAPASTPLNQLTKKQRAHYEAYDKLNTLKITHAQYDRNAVNDSLYAPVSEWCAASAPKYKFESMKAGDKAKEVKNEKAKKELAEKSKLYADMFHLCEDITKSYGSKQYYGIGPMMQKLAGCERDCKAKGYQFLKREWLTSSEYDALYFRTQALLNAQKKQSKDGGRKPKNVQTRDEGRTAKDAQQKGNARQKQ